MFLRRLWYPTFQDLEEMRAYLLSLRDVGGHGNHHCKRATLPPWLFGFLPLREESVEALLKEYDSYNDKPLRDAYNLQGEETWRPAMFRDVMSTSQVVSVEKRFFRGGCRCPEVQIKTFLVNIYA